MSRTIGRILLGAVSALAPCTGSFADGMFSDPYNCPVGDGPWSVAMGDVDGDAWLDLVVANDASDNVSVLLNNRDETFAASVHYAVGEMPRYVSVGDLNRDEWLDLAVTNYSGVSILLNNGNGTFASAQHYAAGDRPPCVAIGDVNGDEWLDLAVANYDSDSVSVLLNRSAIPGDLNGDACVDQADLGILLSDWDCTDGGCVGDCDADGDTDIDDLGILLAHWGEGCA